MTDGVVVVGFDGEVEGEGVEETEPFGVIADFDGVDDADVPWVGGAEVGLEVGFAVAFDGVEEALVAAVDVVDEMEVLVDVVLVVDVVVVANLNRLFNDWTLRKYFDTNEVIYQDYLTYSLP